MATGKWNRPLVLGVWVAYTMLFITYLFYTRTPDYFSGSRTSGKVVEIYEKRIGTARHWAMRKTPIVEYSVEGATYRLYNDDKSYMGLYAEGDLVTIIYDHNHPEKACILGLIGYWINVSEILVALLIGAGITLLVTVIPDGYDDRFTRALKK